jgi:hypothetical protein
MKHLKELGLNIERASFLTPTDPLRGQVSDVRIFNACTCRTLFENGIETFPVFSLQDIIDLLPRVINGCHLDIGKWTVAYNNYEEVRELKSKTRHNLIDAAYEMLCWCLENGYIEKDF